MTKREKKVYVFLTGYPMCFLWPLWSPVVFLYLVLHPKFYRKNWERGE